MINGRRILAIVPARGGSKGVPLKNIKQVLGIPLVARVGHLVQEISIIDRSVASTDYPEIAQIARESGLEVPFMRPPELSGDRIADWDVLHHALMETERFDKEIYDIIVMLQPTSPMRKPEHVYRAIEKLINEEWDAVWTVSKTDSKNHPLKQLRVIDNSLEYYDKQGGDQIIARQQLDTLYHRNGAAYVMTRECIVEQKTIKGAKTGAYVIAGEMISIDTLWDFKLVEFLMGGERDKNE